MRKLLALLSTAAVLMLGVAGHFARANTIEGYTTAGNFQTVFVTPDGRLEVSIGSTTPQHVTIDGGTVTFVATIGSVMGPISVVTSTGGPGLTVTASTTSTQVSGTVTLLANTAAIIYPADVNRRQGFFCNDDLTGLVMHFGDASVTNSTEKFLPAGCVSPDVPGTYTGVIYGISTAAISTSYWYTKTP